jgi:hypothetical protein
MNVGNGGFSLRSKKLHQVLKRLPGISTLYPEDHRICRTYRPQLERLGIRFAPEQLARRFSIEGISHLHRPRAENTWTTEFGFHGLHKTNISAWLALHPQYSIENRVESDFRYSRR